MPIARKEIWEPILAVLAKNNPRETYWNELLESPELSGVDYRDINISAIYLLNHGFIKGSLSGNPAILDWASLTEKGTDLLIKDGGLSTVKNTITVKFHNEAIEVIERFISTHPDPGIRAQSSAVSSRLRELPSAGIEHLFLKLLDLGLARSSEAFQLIQKFLTM